MPVTVTVSQISRRLSMLVKGDKAIQDVYVKGEISDFTRHYKTGHVYFTLNEGECAIKAVMFRNFADNLQFELQDGMNVTVRGGIQLYEKQNVCEIVVSEVKPDGEGGNYLAFEQLKIKLAEKGYFDQKRPLPTYPKKICVVTSETGAAIHDIVNVISRRYPIAKLLLVPTSVQGDNAPYEIAEAMQKAQDTDADLIIVGRGGGSAEDLSAFNTEIVAKAILDSGIPTISAVGHEIDFTIADFVADKRAPTPSAAAEIAVPDIVNIIEYLKAFKNYVKDKLEDKISANEQELERTLRQIKLFAPSNSIERRTEALTAVSESIKNKYEHVIERKQAELEKTVCIMNALTPFSALKRGYAAVFKNEKCISGVEGLASGDKVTVRMNDGYFEAEITSVKSERISK